MEGKCPVCGRELEFKAKSGKYWCDNCEELYSQADVESPLGSTTDRRPETEYWNKLIQDPQVWHKDVWMTDSEYPPIIAHEYRRINELISEGQIYGTMLQVKDLFGVLIKIPVLLTGSIIYHDYQQGNESGKKLIINLLEKPLALGDWASIARTLLKDKLISGELQPILKDIIDVYNKNDIVNWRNETIGHGALGFADDSEFREDLKRKIKILTQHLTALQKHYAEIRFFCRDNEQYIKLTGPDAAKNINHQQSDDLFFSLGEGPLQIAFPYILLDQQGIYFFDTHFSRKQRTCIINYPEGKKNDHQGINRILLEVGHELNLDKIASQELGEGSYNLQDEETFMRLLTIEDYQRPMHIRDWLRKSIEDNDRGLLLLRMERGTGKSTFCRALDPMGINIDDFAPKECSTRVYYLNDSYTYQLDTFCTRIKDLMRMDTKGHLTINKLPQDLRAESTAEEFVQFLAGCRDEHLNYFGKEKLLLIIDGLDEIPPAGKTIFNFIPAGDELPENVYILGTSRLHAELHTKRFSQESLEKLKPGSMLSLSKDGEENQQLMMKYIRTKILGVPEGKPTSQNEQEYCRILMGKTEGRFLYLKAIKEMLTLTNNPNSFPVGSELLGYYLEQMELKYSQKYFNRLLKLLLIIASAPEPLTLRELAFLEGEEVVNFRFQAYLNDLRGFIKVDRSYRGQNLMSISHEEWKRLLEDRYNIELQTLIQKWMDKINCWKEDNTELFTVKENEKSVLWDGESYLLSHFADYTVYICGQEAGKLSFLNAGSLALYLDRCAFSLGNITDKSFYVSERVAGIYGHEIAILDQLEKLDILSDQSEIPPDRNDLAGALMNRGNAYNYITNYEKALADYDRAVKIREELDSTGKLMDRNYLAGVLMNRGVAYNYITDYEKALADYDRVVKIREELDSTGKLMDRSDLAGVLMNRGTTYNLITNYKKALEDYDRAIEIMEKVDSTGKLTDRNDLAAALMNRGNAYNDITDYEKALADYDRAVKIREELDSTGKLMDRSDLAGVLMNRGVTYSHITNYEKALADYDRAVKIKEELDSSGKLMDRSDLAAALMNRGNAYRNVTDYEKALADYDRTTEIMEEMESIGKLSDRNDLATALMNRGNAYRNVTDYEKALADYDRAIEIREELDSAGKLMDRNDLASALMNRGVAFDYITNYEKALADYDRAVKIREELDSTGKLMDRNDLASALMNRGVACNYMMDYEKALADYDRAIEIAEELDITGKLMDRNYLATALMNRGVAYKNITDYEKALADYDRAIEIREELDSAGKLMDRNDLASALMNRGVVFDYITDYEKALADYDLAVEIREELDSAGRLMDRNDLATALMNRVVTFIRVNKFENALIDSLNVVQIRHEILIVHSYLIGEYFKSVYMVVYLALLLDHIDIVKYTLAQLDSTIEQYPVRIEDQEWLQRIADLIESLN